MRQIGQLRDRVGASPDAAAPAELFEALLRLAERQPVLRRTPSRSHIPASMHIATVAIDLAKTVFEGAAAVRAPGADSMPSLPEVGRRRQRRTGTRPRADRK